MLDHIALQSMTQCSTCYPISYHCIPICQHKVVIGRNLNFFSGINIHWELPFSILKNGMILGDEETCLTFNHLNFLLEFSLNNAFNLCLTTVSLHLIIDFQLGGLSCGAISHLHHAITSNASTSIVIVICHVSHLL